MLNSTILVIIAFILVAIVIYFVYKYNKKTNPEPGDGFAAPKIEREINEWERSKYNQFCKKGDPDDKLYVSRGLLVNFDDDLCRGSQGQGACVPVARDFLFLVDFHPEWREIPGKEQDLHWVTEEHVFYKRTSRGYIYDYDPAYNEGIPYNTGCNIVWVLKDGKYYFRYIFPDGVTDGKRYDSGIV